MKTFRVVGVVFVLTISMSQSVHSQNRIIEKRGYVQCVAMTRSLQQPQITMFFKLPAGVKKASELKGILGRVVLGMSVEEVERRFGLIGQKISPGSFEEMAEKYKLGILSWGARNSWNKEVNAADLPLAQQQAEEREFDLVAEGWAKGVDDLAARYGIPKNNVVLVGESQAAQWSLRLALREPRRVLAVAGLIPSSFGLPRPTGNQTFWMITTGEQEGGCENVLDFYSDCRNLGYPMIVKAEPNVGHQENGAMWGLRSVFLNYILKKTLGEDSGAELRKSFSEPLFWGDVVSQAVVPAAKVDDIDPENRVPLPTEAIAKAWKGGEKGL